jgi:nucleoside triphosphate pyrophosphatase
MTSFNPDSELVLASGSRIRRHMLQAAGLSFTVSPADLDEDALRQPLLDSDGRGDASAIASVLCRAKSEAISAQNPNAFVLGADQTLELDGDLFNKPHSIETARETLKRLRGQTHCLHSAVSLAHQGESVWSTVETAHLTMRAFSDAFLEEYLARVGEAACESVGAYQLESAGLQLFEVIEGDYFTILGLPLLAVMKELRQRGLLMT